MSLSTARSESSARLRDFGIYGPVICRDPLWYGGLLSSHPDGHDQQAANLSFNPQAEVLSALRSTERRAAEARCRSTRRSSAAFAATLALWPAALAVLVLFAGEDSLKALSLAASLVVLLSGASRLLSEQARLEQGKAQEEDATAWKLRALALSWQMVRPEGRELSTKQIHDEKLLFALLRQVGTPRMQKSSSASVDRVAERTSALHEALTRATSGQRSTKPG